MKYAIAIALLLAGCDQTPGKAGSPDAQVQQQQVRIDTSELPNWLVAKKCAVEKGTMTCTLENTTHSEWPGTHHVIAAQKDKDGVVLDDSPLCETPAADPVRCTKSLNKDTATVRVYFKKY